jgi:hypothetical protein
MTPDRANALAEARRRYARSDAEGAVFDLAAGWLDRPLAQPSDVDDVPWSARAVVAAARVPAAVLRNPRIANCATLLASG